MSKNRRNWFGLLPVRGGQTDRPVFRQIALSCILDESLNRALNVLGGQDVEIYRSYHADAFIYGNAEKLTDAFYRLLCNSFQAMASIPGKLWLTVLYTQKKFKVVIKDNGIGMSPVVLSPILQMHPFAEERGTGLTIVKSILEQHQACIEIASLTSEGTSVIISFPIHDVAM